VAQLSLRERAIKVLQDAAESDDPRIRSNAMEAAGLAPARNADVLRRGLTDQSIAVRSVAAVAVGGSRALTLVPDVRPLLQDPSPFVRCSAIYALIRCGEDTDRRDLARALLDDPSTRVRSHAAYILGELGDASALPLLRQSLRQRPAKASQIEVNLFQLQVAEALVKLGDDSQLEPLRAALYPSRPEDLEATALAVQILGTVQDKRSIDQLIYLSATRDQTGQMMPAEVRLAIASSLARMGLKQGDFIADEFVKDKKAALRSQAAFVYGETGTPSNMGVLDGLLSDADWAVRVTAAASVVKIADAKPKAEPVVGGRTAAGQ
jgi:HEAT repeat protein